ncbi:MAG TPA: response regulator [Geobacteraceae bacterium]
MSAPRVLIIDDDPGLRKTLGDILRAKGYESVAAGRGAEGLALLERNCVSLALVDLALPDMTGLEVLDRVKAISPSTAVIILTGQAALDTAIEATNRDAFSYLEKPCEMDQLLLQIRRAIEKQQAEKALQESEERFRKIFELGPLGMGLVGLDFRYVKVNEMLCRMLGYSAEELTSRGIGDITHPADIDTSKQYAQRLLDGEVSHYKMEKRYVTRSGELLWGNLTVSLVRDEAGAPLYFLGMVEDITEKKILESQLRHVQKMEVIGHLAGGVAHDFNNILTAIIGFSTLMQMKMDKDSPFGDYLEQILAAADRGAHLTQGLLAFSRKQIMNPVPTDLNCIVKSLEKILPRMIGEETVLQADLAPQQLVVMADPGQIDQVLINLATNAHDAMPGGGTLTIETTTYEMTDEFLKSYGYGTVGHYAMLAIRDTGVGMDERTAARIFEPFFTTKEVGKGTGLGLAIVYGIVKQHNGYINVHSEPGSGTTFRIFFPLIEEDVAPQQAAEPYQWVMGAGETLLVVEDNPEVRSITRMLLEEHGYRVIEAVDGEDAVAKFAAHRDAVRLVIMDVVMPKKNGKEAFAEIQKIRPDAKAIFTSGYTGNTIHHKGVLMEDINFMPKPASPQVFLAKVREMLRMTPPGNDA